MLLPEFLAAQVQGRSDQTRAWGLSCTQRWTDADVADVVAHLSTLGDEERLYKAHPLCRELSRGWTAEITGPDVRGLDHLAQAAARGPTIIVCNHLSYVDATTTDAQIAWAGAPALADRVVFAAGPKVYTSTFRRMATGCLNTLPVPQSTSLGHTAQLSFRELARQAINSVRTAHEALREGYILLIYPEGSRSRTGRLGPFLKGVHRYLEIEGLQVVPAAIVGTFEVMGVENDVLRPGPTSLSFAPAIALTDLTRSREVLLESHRAISDLLPPHMRSLGDADADSGAETPPSET